MLLHAAGGGGGAGGWGVGVRLLLYAAAKRSLSAAFSGSSAPAAAAFASCSARRLATAAAAAAAAPPWSTFIAGGLPPATGREYATAGLGADGAATTVGFSVGVGGGGCQPGGGAIDFNASFELVFARLRVASSTGRPVSSPTATCFRASLMSSLARSQSLPHLSRHAALTSLREGSAPPGGGGAASVGGGGGGVGCAGAGGALAHAALIAAMEVSW